MHRTEISTTAIAALLIKAGDAGDVETAALCRRALRGERKALKRVAWIIRDAQEQDEVSDD